MISISLCMIVKNEERVLARCLHCVEGIADEIIIVDTGSTDKTKEIALQYTEKVYDFSWIEDFSAARNFSLSKATKEYILWLDADDVLDNDNQQALRRLKETLPEDVDMVMMQYHVSFDAAKVPTCTFERERLFKRSMNFHWVGEVHEVIIPRGQILHSDIAIDHQKMGVNEPKRNLKIFEKMRLEGKKLEPRAQYYYGRELYYNGQYEAAITQLEAFIDERMGWVEDLIGGCNILAEAYGMTGKKCLALHSLFKSFAFDTPRGEICCAIGKHFLSDERYETAIFWYNLAASRRVHKNSSGFLLPDCYDYIPYIQLCVCYDRLGDIEKACAYNEKAGQVKPQDQAYLQNRQYFQRRLGERAEQEGQKP